MHVACKEVQFDIVRQINLNAQNVIGMTHFDLSKNVFNLRYSRSNRECCWWFRSRFFLVSFRYPVFFWDNSSHFRRLNTIFITQLRSISQNYLIMNAAKSIQCMLFSNFYYQMSMKKLNLPRKILHLHWRLRRPCLQPSLKLPEFSVILLHFQMIANE